MEITYIGHACFVIKLFTGMSVCFDPYSHGSVPGLSDANAVADLVFCSHSHRDHSDSGSVRKPAVPYTGEKPEVTFINTFHDDVGGSARGKNDITIVNDNGKKIVHMGDIGCDLTDEQTALIKGCDLLMIPVGGFYTIDSKKAYELCQKIDPAVVIPMHYSGDGFGYDVISGREGFADFIRAEGMRQIVDSGSFAGSLPEGKTLLLMDPARKM